VTQKENHNLQNSSSSQLEPKTKLKSELQPDDWLCLLCYKKIASDKDRFLFNNHSEFQFANPNGNIFDIITFITANGCREMGVPTIEFTWFPGHAWSFAVCNRCGLHLGWKYLGKHSFYGLIKSRLIKGSALLN